MRPPRLPNRFLSLARRLVLLSLTLLVPVRVVAQAPDDPVLATFQDKKITLRFLEEFARELPSDQRVPLASESGKWRSFLCRELAKNLLLSEQAIRQGHHTDLRYLRSRAYFTQEYLSYALLRDEVINRIDVSRSTLETLYERRKGDYYTSPTVTLRLIRLRDADAASSAARRIAAGEPFADVEREISEVSPRYKNRVLGPFPRPEDRTAIPPPDEVIEAALATEISTTTGPILANRFWFLIRPESKTPGRQRPFEDVVEEVEKRMRSGMGDHLTRQMMARLKAELGVVCNEAAIGNPATRPTDIVATVGQVRIPYQEFTDLNGRVRGPALQVANLETNRLAHFITPHVLTEAARARGYMAQKEFQRASFYYDLQQLGNRMADHLAGEQLQPPSEGELRARYRQEMAHQANRRGKRPSYDEMREELKILIHQHLRPQMVEHIVKETLTSASFALVKNAVCRRLTAMEALAVAARTLPPEARVIEMVGIRGDDPLTTPPARPETPVPPMPLPLSGLGRHSAWRISYATGAPAGEAPAARDGETTQTRPDVRPQESYAWIGSTFGEVVIEDGGKLHDGSAEFTSSTLYQPWAQLFRFDTDALARVAMDNGLADFAAKYHDKVRISTSVEFSYAGGAPGDCVVRYAVIPADPSVDDGIELRFDANTAVQTRRRVGEIVPPCPTCPPPDKPIL